MEKGRGSLEWGGGERGRPSFLYGFLLFKGKAETALVKGVVREQRHLGSLGGWETVQPALRGKAPADFAPQEYPQKHTHRYEHAPSVPWSVCLLKLVSLHINVHRCTIPEES